ncbi:hypothetical protein J5N97_008657 [Dioscorea zingiberensis]|uniref:non-specific serine/threonine protein kinase n=1 Tax=Dioscorea zingiberensis TaxID=325984 RepID=A0A9D5HLK7_9LILI|nr:hypothetical protein J5N97_008657 [Dioscorea zingiberensis]
MPTEVDHLPAPPQGSKKTPSSSSSSTPPPKSSPNSKISPSPPPPPPRSQKGKNLSSKSSPPVPSHALPTPPPPPPPANHAEKSPEKTAKTSLNTPIIAGAVVGVGLFVVLLVVCCVCYNKKKKKKKSHDPMHYYADSGIKETSGYYSSTIEPKWKNESQDLSSPSPSSSSISIPPPRWQPQLPSLMAESEASSSISSPHAPPLPPPYPTITLGFNKSSFTYEELSVATNGFSQANLLGQGGFGYVHKGVLPSGKEIAVKQLKSGSGQGEREFQAEVDIISRVHHRHLVSLVGYCIAGSQRMLIYEFVPNKTLEYHLHGKGLPTMDWSTRLKVAIGTAKGIAYLHEDCHPRIIHRDIKSANILLDFNFEAMVADFGLAKLSSDNNSHVSTRVMGTFGYLAPEYASSGKLTEKSDVFSFGVMLLELITGKRPTDHGNKFMDDGLVDWARQVMSRAMADGNYDELVDPRLEGNYNPVELARMVGCAAASVRHSAKRRPKMSQILRALEGDVSLEDLNEGVRPGQSMLFSSGSDYDSSPKTSHLNRFRKASLTSPEFSGEYGSPMDGRHPMHQYQAAMDHYFHAK